LGKYAKKVEVLVPPSPQVLLWSDSVKDETSLPEDQYTDDKTAGTVRIAFVEFWWNFRFEANNKYMIPEGHSISSEDEYGVIQIFDLLDT
jgi:hypothetical protein